MLYQNFRVHRTTKLFEFEWKTVPQTCQNVYTLKWSCGCECAGRYAQYHT
jgi:hypothetical protein